MEETVTIGIITHKRPEYLKKCLMSILQQSVRPYEVIICEDNSCDFATKKVVDSLYPKLNQAGIGLSFFRFTERKRQPHLRNRIIDAAGGSIIAYLDDDTEAARDWLKSLLEPYRSESVFGVGGPAIASNNKLNPQFGILRSGRNMNVFTDYGGIYDFSHKWIPPAPLITHLCLGANMSFRKAALEENRFDTAYQGTCPYEETDVMAQLFFKKMRMVYHPGALVYHKLAPSGGSRMDRGNALYWVGFNTIYFIRKHFRKKKLKVYLMLLLKANRSHPTGAVRAFFSAIFNRDLSRFYLLKGYLDGLLEHEKE